MLFRYVAAPHVTRARSKMTGAIKKGEIAGDSVESARASLRKLGLRVISVEPLRSRAPIEFKGMHRYLRTRRRLVRAEIYDSLATLIDSGISLIDALETTMSALPRGGRLRMVMAQIREDVRGGESLDRAMVPHESWFDSTEIAMIGAGQHGGHMTSVMRSLANRHERSGILVQKLLSALAYPTIVSFVGLGVLIFLSTKTLPDLTRILRDSKVEVPSLTRHVMSLGQTLAHNFGWFALGALGIFGSCFAIKRLIESSQKDLPNALRKWTPTVTRRLAVAAFSSRLAELLRSGVPLLDSLRVLAPTLSNRSMRQTLLRSAERVERGEALSVALDDEVYFDAEFRRLLEIGEASGELSRLLHQIGERYERRSSRLIDRLSSLLEPIVILILALLVGTVVMAAILPIVRLQEIL